MGQMFPQVNQKMNLEQFVNESGYGWKVEKKPIFIQDADGNFVEVDHRKMTTRINDDGSMVPFEGVGNNFEVIQNVDAFRFLTDLFDHGDLLMQNILETGGGKQVVMNCQLPEHVTIAGEDVATYVAFSNGHGGNGSAMSLAHNMQLCCTNQLAALKLTSKYRYSIRHTRNAKLRLEDARQAMKLAFKQTEELATIADELAVEPITNSYYNMFMRELTQIDKIDAKKQPRAHRRAMGVQSAIHEILRNAEYLQNQRIGRSINRWSLYQATTDYTSNVERFRGHRGNRFMTMAKGHPLANRALEILTA